MTEGTLANTNYFRMQWLLLALILLMVGGTIGYALIQGHSQQGNSEEKRLTNLAKVIEANLGRQLEVTATALFDLREDLLSGQADVDNRAHLNRQLQKTANTMPGLRTLLVLDAAGNTLASNRKELVGRNFSERDYFQTARQQHEPTLFHLSPPFKSALGVYTMNMHLMVPGPNGAFNGLVAASMDPEYFTLLLNSVLYAHDMRASLTHGDGMVFLLVPERRDVTGMNLATPGSFFTLHRDSGRLASFFPNMLSITGENRIMALRTIKPQAVKLDKPLVVALSRDMSIAFQSWHRNMIVQVGLFTLLCLLTGGGLHLYQRRQREYHRLAMLHLAELHQARALLDATGHIARIGGWALELDTQQVIWSTETYNIHEVDRTQPTPAKEQAIAYYPPEARPVLLTALEECATTGKPVDLVLPFVTTTGRHLWVNVQAAAERENNRIVRLIGALQDITQRKQAEEENLRLESQLRQAQKMEAIGTLAGGIAHDFNNILAIIFGYNELAMDEEDPKKRRQDLEELEKAAIRAKELVAQILAFSRKAEQQRQPLQVALIVKEALKMLRASLPTTITIRQNIACNGRVLADASQIHQVIMNLCTNAYHAMRETGGTLAVSLEEVPLSAEEYGFADRAPGNYLKLEVSDTGVGIDPQIQERIFEPYFTTKKQGDGTGMGLAVVHGIVKSHHGHITVYSEPGQGTSFHVYLPLTPQEIPAFPGAASAPQELRGKGERIMLVDDEAQIREVVGAMLRSHNYQVTAFADGKEALTAFQQAPRQFDLVISDMTMPVMTGAELAQSILALRTATPIILCSGQSELMNRDKAMAMGISDYLLKPVPTDVLLAAARNALDMQVVAAQA